MKIFKPGEVIAREGETAKDLLILVRGKIAVVKNDLKVAEFSDAGSVVGEMSVILNSTRTATIVAEDESFITYLQADIDKIIREYPELAKKIMMNLADRLRHTTEELYCLANEVKVKPENS
ncbi:MAG: cyclic nucleotide-binding domain-containing protein [Ignavibacteriaceae bacterium]|nr:cyclic nucleotide-binding domain-containing protein [Ignavibacteriaceae bacterium]NUM71254.1 cyclic nucleotide-binding domain-containing protein [Ignavibacteriaceae bacterium]